MWLCFSRLEAVRRTDALGLLLLSGRMKWLWALHRTESCLAFSKRERERPLTADPPDTLDPFYGHIEILGAYCRIDCTSFSSASLTLSDFSYSLPSQKWFCCLFSFKRSLSTRPMYFFLGEFCLRKLYSRYWCLYNHVRVVRNSVVNASEI